MAAGVCTYCVQPGCVRTFTHAAAGWYIYWFVGFLPTVPRGGDTAAAKALVTAAECLSHKQTEEIQNDYISATPTFT